MRHFLIGLILFISMIGLTGCWDRKELSDLSIATALGFDYAENGITLSAQLVNPNEIASAKGGGSNRAAVSVYSVTGKTTFEAIRKLQLQMPRKLYVSYVRMIVISQELAEKGFHNILDFILRGHEFRSDFHFVIAKGSRSETILRTLTPLVKVPAFKMYSELKSAERFWGAISAINIHELISNLIDQKRETVLPSIIITGDPSMGPQSDNVSTTMPPAKLQFHEMAIFKKDRLIGWLTEDQSKGYNYTQDRIRDTIESFPCSKKGNISVEIRKTKSELQGVVENGRPKGKISVQASGALGDVECSIDNTREDVLTSLAKKTEKRIVSQIQQALHKAQTLQTDIFGFAEAIEQSQPQEWKKIEPHWNELFSELPVEISVDVEVKGSGSISESVEKMMKEK